MEPGGAPPVAAMKILLAGGTGFIGTALVKRLTADGHTCAVLVRKDPAAYPSTEGVTYISYRDLPGISDVDAVINLAGEWVVGRWTEAKKDRIMESRVAATRLLVDWMASQPVRPKVFLSGSAVGIYGHRPGEILTEDSPLDPEQAFRYRVCKAWEEEANRARDLGIRTVNLRIGNVLDGGGGLLKLLVPWLRRSPVLIPFAPNNVNSWIALPDAVSLIEFALTNDAIEGPLNVVGPRPVTIRQLVQAIGKAIRRPVLGRIPDAVMQAIFGEFSRSLLDSQQILPAKALANGFQFEQEDLPQFLAITIPL
ncbi:TIGR01777 family oxidoreductase [Fimbriimonas ginsengisoli]|uniref:Cell division inhibitor n=1 Tax=Fimbriimonas ginsengisoli Gsoil 348 TaxID=661478 RepID=A0A068NR88_FIMGI|nr:TIGR01777 family oxidoreductase [Fimbriimonas ginsengisoli]AIE85956.1 Cell division inhibitor [Fimbriimonas ginsengisoli Gsoil 348]